MQYLEVKIMDFKLCGRKVAECVDNILYFVYNTIGWKNVQISLRNRVKSWIYKGYKKEIFCKYK